MEQYKSLVRLKPRSEWTNLDWASYLQCPIQEVPVLQNYISENYLPTIGKNRVTGKYHFCVLKLHVSPSGWRDWHLWLSDDKKGFTNESDVVRYVNETVIPTLQFNDAYAKLADIPVRALQLMHMTER